MSQSLTEETVPASVPHVLRTGRRPRPTRYSDLLIAVCGDRKLTFRLGSDLYYLLRSVRSADLAKVVDRQMNARWCGSKARAALRDLAIVMEELARTGGNWRYRVLRVRH
jgi:hypothetical protein